MNNAVESLGLDGSFPILRYTKEEKHKLYIPSLRVVISLTAKVCACERKIGLLEEKSYVFFLEGSLGMFYFFSVWQQF